MKRKFFSLGLAFWVLAFTSPASAFICGVPCHMSQKQMLQCAKAYSAQTHGTSVGSGACMKLEFKGMPQFTGGSFVSLHAPKIQALASLLVAPPMTPKFPSLAALRGPPLSPQQAQLSALPASNAPPALA